LMRSSQRPSSGTRLLADRAAPGAGRRSSTSRRMHREGRQGGGWFDGGLHATKYWRAPAHRDHLSAIRATTKTMRILRDNIILAVHANPTAWSWCRAGTCESQSAGTLDWRHPAALPEVHRARQQPRLYILNYSRRTSRASSTRSGCRDHYNHHQTGPPAR
jgi:hypothetical protein